MLNDRKLDYPEIHMKETTLKEIAERFGLVQIGVDKKIKQLGSVTSFSTYQENKLSYVTSEKYFQDFLDYGVGACIIPRNLQDLVPENCSVLLTEDDAMSAFYNIYNTFVSEGRWEKIANSIGKRNVIAHSAVIHDHVEIGNDCIIMDNVVVLPNTKIGDRVVIKPNTVIGGDGFQVRAVNGIKRVIPHVGGVWICDDVEIGSNVCIDKGLFGDFTYIGKETKLDNLVQIAHSVKIGERCNVAASSTICGNIYIGSNVWIGANTTINNRLKIGDRCYIGSHSVIRRSLGNNVKAYTPYSLEKIHICDCGETLDFYNKKACCEKCGSTYCLYGKLIEKV